MPTVTSDPTPRKYLVAGANSKTRMYECIVHKDHVTCNCQSFKYNSLCKYSLCVAQTVERLKEHVDYAVVRLSTSKKSRTGLVVPPKSAVGKKRGRTRMLGVRRHLRVTTVSKVSRKLQVLKRYKHFHPYLCQEEAVSGLFSSTHNLLFHRLVPLWQAQC